MPSGINDWRSWTNQQELAAGTPFPGQNAINDAEILRGAAADTFPILVVSAATTANPAVLTTPTPHGYATGEAVTISGALVALELNGTFLVTVLSPTTFSIPVNNTHAYTASSASVQPTGVFPLTLMGAVSVPTYPYAPTGVNPVDPFAGWTTQDEDGPSIAVTGVGIGASPVTVTTGAPHGFITGQTVAILGVAGTVAPAINGSWVVTVLTATTFTVTAVTTGLVYTAASGIARLDSQRPAVLGLTA